MTRNKLEKWQDALNKLDNAEDDALNCGWLSCKNCILRNEGADCERTKIQHAISAALKRVEHAIEKVKPCPTCGHGLRSED